MNLVKKEELLDVIYNYYPKGVNNDRPEVYTETPAYILRKQVCEVARENISSRLSLKKTLAIEIENINGRYADYSVLGATPAYYLIEILEWLNRDILNQTVYDFSIPEINHLREIKIADLLFT